jgi:hypothetical protein
MTLYEKLVQAYKDRAKQATPGNSMILGENNSVPEMLAEIAVKVVNEHEHEHE